MLANVLKNLWDRMPRGGRRRGDTPADGLDYLLAEGLAHHKAGDLHAAGKVYEELLMRDPTNHDALHLLGMLAYRRGDLDGAEVSIRRALDLVPQSAEFRNTLATVLSDMGRHDEAHELLTAALRDVPGSLKARSNLLFLLNIMPGISRERIFAEHLAWASMHTEEYGAAPNHACSAGQARLRIGYVSADFFGHPVGRIISAVLKQHDSRRFEIYCYDNGSQADEVNAALRRHAEHWIEVAEMDDEQLTGRIRSDGIQVLVDLSGHTRKNRLKAFARRPAPVQATWLGYLNTTGMSAIDWRITDARADPPQVSQQWHVERLCYLSKCAWPWSPPELGGMAAFKELPGVKAGHVTFGSFNTFRKINLEVIAAWAGLLREVPNARLRVHGAPGGRAVDRVYDLFEAAGIRPERVDLFAVAGYQRYLQAYQDIDIALDPFPYNGGATTCESLWMGVPVVTLAGSGGFARSGASILGAVGLDELVAVSVEDYIGIAASLARDTGRLSAMRATLRKRVLDSPLGDAAAFTRDLEDAYRGMWREWCGQSQAAKRQAG